MENNLGLRLGQKVPGMFHVASILGAVTLKYPLSYVLWTGTQPEADFISAIVWIAEFLTKP